MLYYMNNQSRPYVRVIFNNANVYIMTRLKDLSEYNLQILLGMADYIQLFVTSIDYDTIFLEMQIYCKKIIHNQLHCVRINFIQMSFHSM